MSLIYDYLADSQLSFKLTKSIEPPFITYVMHGTTEEDKKQILSKWLDSLDKNKVVVFRAFPEFIDWKDGFKFRTRYYQ